MPAYNSAQFIGEAIESVLMQTFNQFELIIVDDGSTDNTPAIIKTYAAKDDRIKFLQSQHIGASAARNLATQKAIYPWLAIMDSDDISLPHRFARQVQAIRSNPNVVVWGAYVNHISADNRILSLQKYGLTTEEEFYKIREQGRITFTIHSASILNKRVFLEVGGYNPSFLAAHDLDLIDRMADYGPILTIPEALLLYRIHSESLSSQKFFAQIEVTEFVSKRCQERLRGNENHFTFEQFTAFKKTNPSLLSRLHVLSRFYYRRAGLEIANNQYLKGCLFLCLSILLNPAYALPRVWSQRLSLEAHRSLRS